MVRYTSFFLVLLCTLVLQNCEEDAFSQVTIIELPEHESKPVANLSIRPDARSLFATISNSKGLLVADSAYQVPTDASVVVFRNNTEFTTFRYQDSAPFYVTYLPEPFAPTVGEEYHLEVNIPGFETVSSTQIVPPQPNITDGTYEIDGAIDFGGFRTDEVVVDIEDVAPDEINYYRLNLFEVTYRTDPAGDTTGFTRIGLYVDTTDPLLRIVSDGKGLLFTDEQFSSGSYQVRCLAYGSGEEEVAYEASLQQLTLDHYLYIRSRSQYNEAIDNPFAEPVTVHSNIVGGYGNFSVWNSVDYVLERK